jgi:hypothetical protein
VGEGKQAASGWAHAAGAPRRRRTDDRGCQRFAVGVGDAHRRAVHNARDRRVGGPQVDAHHELAAARGHALAAGGRRARGGGAGAPARRKRAARLRMRGRRRAERACAAAQHRRGRSRRGRAVQQGRRRVCARARARARWRRPSFAGSAGRPALRCALAAVLAASAVAQTARGVREGRGQANAAAARPLDGGERVGGRAKCRPRHCGLARPQRRRACAAAARGRSAAHRGRAPGLARAPGGRRRRSPPPPLVAQPPGQDHARLIDSYRAGAPCALCARLRFVSLLATATTPLLRPSGVSRRRPLLGPNTGAAAAAARPPSASASRLRRGAHGRGGGAGRAQQIGLHARARARCAACTKGRWVTFFFSARCQEERCRGAGAPPAAAGRHERRAGGRGWRPPAAPGRDGLEVGRRSKRARGQEGYAWRARGARAMAAGGGQLKGHGARQAGRCRQARGARPAAGGPRGGRHPRPRTGPGRRGAAPPGALGALPPGPVRRRGGKKGPQGRGASNA